ncbi:MAG: hypothetical protein K6T90_21260 [Leptolyngbyaceae cyanobacterium HOT.MB2.61]|nr:hypothetical protein [Leptolyngbyaceae cyanobacterium HOT.MB2.61]
MLPVPEISEASDRQFRCIPEFYEVWHCAGLRLMENLSTTPIPISSIPAPPESSRNLSPLPQTLFKKPNLGYA